MDLLEILKLLGVPVSTGLIIILLSFVKIPRLEVNIWQLLGKALSNGLVGPVMIEIQKMNAKIDDVDCKLDRHIVKSGEEAASRARTRILRFSDELICGQEHTKEHFRDMLITIDDYEKYCEDHPDFPNSRCLIAIENIKDIYAKKCKDNSFVTIERLVVAVKDNED